MIARPTPAPRPRYARLLVGLAALPALVMACSAPPAEAPPAPSAPVPAPASTDSPLADPAAPCGDVTALPVRDKLAQLLMVGVRDAADARAVVADHHVGGIFIGSWTDLSLLTDGSSLPDIKAQAGPVALAVSVDEEGGRVSRLSSLIGSSPSAKVLAQNNSPEAVYQIALERGRKMHDLGITIDFAPVVDVTDAADDTVIGDRSFGSDPQRVTEYADAYARGLHDAGLMPVLKHFPGHGHGSGDTHTGAVSTPPLSQLQDSDLVPYRSLVNQHGSAVMIGHLQVPELTGSDPASLSPAAVNLLRQGGGYGGPPYNGVIFTDDLSSMAAINARFGVPEAVLRALQAGVDVALWVTTDEVAAVLDHLEAAVERGDFPEAALNNAVQRVAGAKGAGPACAG